MTKLINRPAKKLILTSEHRKIMSAIVWQDEIFLEFVHAKTGFSISYSNKLMAEIAVITSRYIPEIAWVCTGCHEVNRIPLREGLRISSLGSTTTKCNECSRIVSIKAFDTIVTWKKTDGHN